MSIGNINSSYTTFYVKTYRITIIMVKIDKSSHKRYAQPNRIRSLLEYLQSIVYIPTNVFLFILVLGYRLIQYHSCLYLCKNDSYCSIFNL